MGTRNLTVCVFNECVKLAQYGQWDGYPSGAGAEVFDELKNIIITEQVDVFLEILSACRFINDDTIKNYYAEAGKDSDDDFVTLEVAQKFKENHTSLDRDIGAQIIKYIYDNGPQELSNNIDFAKDSVFCEWAYVIDFDKKIFEVYKGFNDKKLSKKDRFFYLQDTIGPCYPIKILTSFSFDDIRHMDINDFIEKTEKERTD